MPLQGSMRVSKPLSNLSIRYDNAEYIANKVMPDILVEKESDMYYIYNNDLRLEETIRANGAPAKQIVFDVSTSTYTLNEHALKDSITDRDRANVDEPPLKLEVDKVENLTSKIQLRLEYEVATLLFTTTAFGNNATLTSATSWLIHTTTSAPIQNVLSASSYIQKYSGVKPNMLVMSLNVRDALKENDNIHDRIKYTQKSVYTEELLASVFDVQNVYVGSAMYNAALEGSAASMSGIWGDHCLVAYVEPNPGLKTRSMGGTMRLRNQGLPWKVTRWRDDDLSADVIQVSTFFKPKVLASTSGYLFKSCAL